MAGMGILALADDSERVKLVFHDSLIDRVMLREKLEFCEELDYNFQLFYGFTSEYINPNTLDTSYSGSDQEEEPVKEGMLDPNKLLEKNGYIELKNKFSYLNGMSQLTQSKA